MQNWISRSGKSLDFSVELAWWRPISRPIFAFECLVFLLNETCLMDISMTTYIRTYVRLGQIAKASLLIHEARWPSNCGTRARDTPIRARYTTHVVIIIWVSIKDRNHKPSNTLLIAFFSITFLFLSKILYHNRTRSTLYAFYLILIFLCLLLFRIEKSLQKWNCVLPLYIYIDV